MIASNDSDTDEKRIKPKNILTKNPQIQHESISNTLRPNSIESDMTHEEFRRHGKEMIDYIADYLTNIHERRVTPEVEPGYLRPMLPEDAPEKGEPWNEIMKDVDRTIMPGITHWQHPRFHAYFPAGNSYPSILAEMLSSGLGIVGFSWAASPACTELEPIMLDWLGRMMSLPTKFLPFNTNKGCELETPSCDNDSEAENNSGAVLLGSASECILVAMLAARTKKLESKRLENPSMEDGQILSKLVCYTSKLAHSSVEKASLIAMVQIRHLIVDEHYSLRGQTLDECIQADKEQGLIPFFVCGTLGTTSCCSFDNFEELGQICQREQLWLHVDGAYAGAALICDEYRYLSKGFEYVDSFNTNPNKWLLMNFDCSCFWVQDKFAVINAMSVDPLYLQHKHTEKSTDLRHWGIALSRRFRSLKLWFTIRSYGVEGLRHYIREHCRLAKVFAALINEDDRFEIVGDVVLGLVCFRLKGKNKLTEKLLLSLNDSGQLHVVPSMVNDIFLIRFAICAKDASEYDMHIAFQIIQTYADGILYEYKKSSSSTSIRRC
ncbi:unnamed protein product [Adineta steineri]|uniref:Aromatic-L-amino-acid decarboxylase n=1 Tax=Adineta steineri TaxID=433720 RepID=A0A818GV41_9BILA|nr:unnamed protein product [Adineta steineri]CAF3496470.1 unnamed protein product [Adineta steineri]